MTSCPVAVRGLVRVLAAALFVAAIAACDSIDPTSNGFGITFVNDTGRAVHLKLCSDGGCRHFDYSDRWKIGYSGEENISDQQLLTRWLVEDDVTGRTLGCLPLEFDRKYQGVVVRISQKVPCPGKTPLVVTSTIASSDPVLSNAVALATAVAIAPGGHVAEFRLRCGWYLHPKRRVRPGLWRVSLNGAAFSFETYPNGTASGISHTETRRQWVRMTEGSGWSGTLHLSPTGSEIGNGPTTDICAGVLG